MPETQECQICGVAHDEEIHEATLSIHRWLRGQILDYLFESDESMQTWEIPA